ncbi:MAG: hypothetical protein IKF16_12195 [Lachnospiraceae bacterium]|nr:hypothetical protein [Lachnospiraceae bacterium]
MKKQDNCPALKKLLVPYLIAANKADYMDGERLNDIAEEYLADVRSYLQTEHGISVADL